jgi:hypothetical protein
VAQHDGVEPRPNGPYFKTRTEKTSQGDVFDDVPLQVTLPTDDGGEITAEQAMVLTASCHIDHRTDWLIVAPVLSPDRVGLDAATLGGIREYDCHHRVMLLPAEGDRPERVVRLDRQQPISRQTLELCDRDSQLTLQATRQLMRKLVLYQTGNHFPREVFGLPDGDFDETP